MLKPGSWTRTEEAEVDSEELAACCTDCGADLPASELDWNDPPMRCRDCLLEQSERQEQERIRQQQLARTGIPSQRWDWSLRSRRLGMSLSWWHLPAVRRLEEWVDQGGGLYLHGPPRSGKTSVAMAAAMDCLRKVEPEALTYLREDELMRLPQHRNLPNLRAEYRLETYERTPVLVLDDIGAHRLNPYMRDVLYDLVVRRYPGGGRGEKTLWVGRRTPEELEAWLRGAEPGGSGSALAALFRDWMGRHRAWMPEPR